MVSYHLVKSLIIGLKILFEDLRHIKSIDVGHNPNPTHVFFQLLLDFANYNTKSRGVCVWRGGERRYQPTRKKHINLFCGNAFNGTLP